MDVWCRCLLIIIWNILEWWWKSRFMDSWEVHKPLAPWRPYSCIITTFSKKYMENPKCMHFNMSFSQYFQFLNGKQFGIWEKTWNNNLLHHLPSFQKSHRFDAAPEGSLLGLKGQGQNHGGGERRKLLYWGCHSAVSGQFSSFRDGAELLGWFVNQLCFIPR